MYIFTVFYTNSLQYLAGNMRTEGEIFDLKPTGSVPIASPVS